MHSTIASSTMCSLEKGGHVFILILMGNSEHHLGYDLTTSICCVLRIRSESSSDARTSVGKDRDEERGGVPPSLPSLRAADVVEEVIWVEEGKKNDRKKE